MHSFQIALISLPATRDWSVENRAACHCASTEETRHTGGAHLEAGEQGPRSLPQVGAWKRSEGEDKRSVRTRIPGRDKKGSRVSQNLVGSLPLPQYNPKRRERKGKGVGGREREREREKEGKEGKAEGSAQGEIWRGKPASRQTSKSDACCCSRRTGPPSAAITPSTRTPAGRCCCTPCSSSFFSPCSCCCERRAFSTVVETGPWASSRGTHIPGAYGGLDTGSFAPPPPAAGADAAATVARGPTAAAGVGGAAATAATRAVLLPRRVVSVRRRGVSAACACTAQRANCRNGRASEPARGAAAEVGEIVAALGKGRL